MSALCDHSVMWLWTRQQATLLNTRPTSMDAPFAFLFSVYGESTFEVVFDAAGNFMRSSIYTRRTPIRLNLFDDTRAKFPYEVRGFDHRLSIAISLLGSAFDRLR